MMLLYYWFIIYLKICANLRTLKLRVVLAKYKKKKIIKLLLLCKNLNYAIDVKSKKN